MKKEWHEEAISMYRSYRDKAKECLFDADGSIGELCVIYSCKAIALSDLLDKFGYIDKEKI